MIFLTKIEFTATSVQLEALLELLSRVDRIIDFKMMNSEQRAICSLLVPLSRKLIARYKSTRRREVIAIDRRRKAKPSLIGLEYHDAWALHRIITEWLTLISDNNLFHNTCRDYRDQLHQQLL